MVDYFVGSCRIFFSKGAVRLPRGAIYRCTSYTVVSTTDGMDYDPSKQVFEIWEDLVVCRMATSLVLWGVWTSLGLKLIEKELNMLDFIFQSLYILD